MYLCWIDMANLPQQLLQNLPVKLVLWPSVILLSQNQNFLAMTFSSFFFQFYFIINIITILTFLFVNVPAINSVILIRIIEKVHVCSEQKFQN